jgi:hypothetical protein
VALKPVRTVPKVDKAVVPKADTVVVPEEAENEEVR